MIGIRVATFAQLLVTMASAYYSNQVKDLLAWPDNPEERIVRLPPDDLDTSDWGNTAGAESVGSVIAGMAEFPYLVDVQLVTRDEEDWAVGNLLSHKNVLTTCRWANFYLKLTSERNIDWSFQKPKARWRPNNPELLVFYAPLYVHDFRETPWYVLWGGPNVKDCTGTRSVKFISTHPQCEVDAINFDYSVLTLSREIPPILPYIGYMPIRIERNNLLITDFDLSKHENKRIMCYVASFGRDYRNWKSHIAIGYKVKYRVYYEDWGVCTTHLEKYRCPSIEQDAPHKPGAYYEIHHCPGELVDPRVNSDFFGKGFDNLMCFNSRARIGAVCDHDNGGPLVCDGKVFGIVTRGVHHKFCSNILPVPFVVAKITPASDYYMNLARKPYSFSLLVDSKDLARSSALDLKPSPVSSLLSVTLFLLHFHV